MVETTNFTDQETFRGATAQRKVIERFTRLDPDSIDYDFTVEDPAAFSQSWTAEYPSIVPPG